MSHPSFEGIRVILDLASFFGDKRKKCYYFIDFSRTKLVRDVCDGIKSKFGIRNSIYFEVNDCYVPEDENVKVLYNEDVIKVFERPKCKDRWSPLIQNEERGLRTGYEDLEEDTLRFVSDSLNVTKFKRSKVNEENENCEMTVKSKPKKRCKTRNFSLKEENEECGSVKGSENSSHVLKSTNTELDTCKEIKECVKVIDNYSSLIGTTPEKLIHTSEAEVEKPTNNVVEKKPTKICEVQMKDFDKDSTSKSCEQACKIHPTTNRFIRFLGHDPVFQVNQNRNNIDGSKEDFSQADMKLPNELGESFYKRKRRRKHKKKLNLNDLNSDKVFSEQLLPVTSIIDYEAQKTAKHIKFSDNEENIESHNNESCPDNAHDNNEINSFIPSQQSVKSENSDCVKNENDNSSKYVSLNSSMDLTDSNRIISNNFVSTSGTTPVIFECKRANKLKSNLSETTETDLNFLKYPLLHNSPKVNDIVAFKKWKMDANYCPKVSGFISAKVLKVTEERGKITLRILNGRDEFKEPKGKFSLEEEEENEESEQSKQNEIEDIEMSVSDLIDIRLMFP